MAKQLCGMIHTFEQSWKSSQSAAKADADAAELLAELDAEEAKVSKDSADKKKSKGRSGRK